MQGLRQPGHKSASISPRSQAILPVSMCTLQIHQASLLEEPNIVGLLVPALVGSCRVSWQAAVNLLLAVFSPQQVGPSHAMHDHHTCLRFSLPHNPRMSLQEAARPHSLTADLAEILASAIQHGVLPAVDMLGVSDEQWFPLGWASAAAVDPNAALPFSHLVSIKMALGCDPGDSRMQSGPISSTSQSMRRFRWHCIELQHTQKASICAQSPALAKPDAQLGTRCCWVLLLSSFRVIMPA